jgi:hypothetical protein
MSFYEALKSKYLHDLSVDKVEPEVLEKVIETNIWPSDFIHQNDKVVSIYSPEVTLDNIFDFFKARMPWLKFEIRNQGLLDSNPGELLAMKFICFHQLAGLLSDVHKNFKRAFQREGLPEIEEKINGVTLH